MIYIGKFDMIQNTTGDSKHFSVMLNQGKCHMVSKTWNEYLLITRTRKLFTIAVQGYIYKVTWKRVLKISKGN